jgi:peptidoglycan/LPS O-acetylase OafA/YrhL
LRETSLFKNRRYRKDIQVLRGLAVLAVVLFHAKEDFFPLGYLGVDAFFVISGFVVTPLILRIMTQSGSGKGNVSKLILFYRYRFYRLAPALSVMLVFSAILIFLFGPANDHQRFASQGIATLFLVGNFGAYKYSGDYFNYRPNPLVHTWSLSVEEQIYICIPIVLSLMLLHRKRIFRIALILFILITLFSFLIFYFPAALEPIYSKIGTNYTETSFSFYSSLDRIWQFTLGGVGYLLFSEKHFRFKNNKIVIHLLVVSLLIFSLFGANQFSLKINSVVVSIITLISIILGSLNYLPGFLLQRLEWLGDRSYSIYLIHMPLLYLAKYSQVGLIGKGENRIIPSIIAVILTLILGSVSYSKIENRYRYRVKNETIRKKSFILGLSLSLFLPLSLFVTIDRAVHYKYWGLNEDSFRPSTASNEITGCVNDLAQNRICINASVGATKTVLLIGDSHAGHISIALRDSANKEKWNSVYLESSKVQDIENSSDDRVINWISANRPDLIIISQYWQLSTPQDIVRDRILFLKGIVPNIVIFENNPIWPDPDHFELSGSVVSLHKIPTYFPKDKMNIEDKVASNQLATWARDYGMHTINFDHLFCNDKICSRYSSSEWLYSDYNHLSIAGAARTIPQISALLENFKPARK